jgi:hypothetical protein
VDTLREGRLCLPPRRNSCVQNFWWLKSLVPHARAYPTVRSMSTPWEGPSRLRFTEAWTPLETTLTVLASRFYVAPSPVPIIHYCITFPGSVWPTSRRGLAEEKYFPMGISLECVWSPRRNTSPCFRINIQIVKRTARAEIKDGIPP